MARYDKQAVKDAAENDWLRILPKVAGIDPDLLDGKHHACPKCGGADRFRLIDAKAGACLCNQCFSDKNGDGLAAIRWLTGWDFGATIAAVAKECGVKPIKGAKADPAKHLDWMPWNDTLAGLWCLKKKPIKVDAIKAIGGRFARYRNQFTVIAIPVWGASLEKEPPVGWIIYRPDGNSLPKGKPDAVEWVKVKLVEGSQQGVVCDPKVFSQAGELWKTEGSTDLLALLSAESVPAFTTANGAKEKPLDWIVKLCEGRDVIVIHDADTPGQDGATWVGEPDGRKRPGWCPSLAKSAKSVCNLTLPFTVEATKGPDIRDFLAGGGTMGMLRERIATAEAFTGQDAEEAETFVEEAEDDPQRLARVNLKVYEEGHRGRLVYWRDEWWKWKAGKYRRIEGSELRAKVWAAVRAEFERCWRIRQKTGDDKPVRKVTKALISNVIGAMESICCIPSSAPMPCWLPDKSQPHIVAASNGLLYLDRLFAGDEDCLQPHSSDWFSAFCLEYPFDPDADCPIWMRFLETTMEGDAERIAILQEWAGYLLTGKNDLQRFLAIEGEGGNGKTVYTAGITAMLGQENVSRVALEKFGGQFDLAMTIGKAANICGDVGEIDKAAEAELKQFTGGDVMQFDRKKITPLTVRPTAKLIMSWNRRPKFGDRSDGLWRRMLLVPFNYKPVGKQIVRGMDDHDWWIQNGQAPGILLWAIEGLRRLRTNGDFTESQVVNAAISDYQTTANPAMEFLQEYVEPSDVGAIVKIRLYEMYQYFCLKTGHRHPLSQRQFGKEVRKIFPEAKDGKISGNEERKNCYLGIRFSSEEIFSRNAECDSLF